MEGLKPPKNKGIDKIELFMPPVMVAFVCTLFFLLARAQKLDPGFYYMAAPWAVLALFGWYESGSSHLKLNIRVSKILQHFVWYLDGVWSTALIFFVWERHGLSIAPWWFILSILFVALCLVVFYSALVFGFATHLIRKWSGKE